MNITCDKCGKKYSIPDAKIEEMQKAGKGSAKVRCKQCSNQITLSLGAPAAAAAPIASRGSGVKASPAASPDGGAALGGDLGDDGGGVVPKAGPAWEEERTRAMPALDMSVTWFAMIGGAQQGPFDLASLKTKVDGGEVTLRTYLWKPGMADWKRASDVPEVSPVFAGVSVGATATGPTQPASVPKKDVAVATEVPSPEVTDRVSRDPAPAAHARGNGHAAAAVVADVEPDPSQSVTQPPDEPQAQALRQAALKPNPQLNDLFADFHGDGGATAEAPPPQETSAEQPARAAAKADPFAQLSQDDGVEPPPPGEATKFFIAQAGVNKRNPPWKIALFVASLIALPAAVLYLLSTFKVIPPVTRTTEDGRVEQVSWFSGEGVAGLKDILTGEAKRKEEEAERKRQAAADAKRKAEALAKAQAAGTPEAAPTTPDKGTGTNPTPTSPADNAKAMADWEKQMMAENAGGIGGKTPKVRLEDRQAQAAVNTGGGLSAEVISKTVAQKMGGFEACITNALRRNPNLAVGNIELVLDVGTSGTVKSATVDPKKHEGADWAQCMVAAGKRIVFPGSSEASEVRLPFKIGVAL